MSKQEVGIHDSEEYAAFKEVIEQIQNLSPEARKRILKAAAIFLGGQLI